MAVRCDASECAPVAEDRVATVSVHAAHVPGPVPGWWLRGLRERRLGRLCHLIIALPPFVLQSECLDRNCACACI